MRNLYYILDGHNAVPCDDVMEWAKRFESTDGQVASTDKDGVRVSTVFLGTNHQYGSGEPLLFETMIFGGKNDEYQERCSTWEEAETEHAKACKIAFGEAA